jgi:hypothetical protein
MAITDLRLFVLVMHSHIRLMEAVSNSRLCENEKAIVLIPRAKANQDPHQLKFQA